MPENQKSFQELLAFWKNMDNNCSSTYNELNTLNTNPSFFKKEKNNISELESDLVKKMVLESENLKDENKLLKTSGFKLVLVDAKNITVEQTKGSKKNIIIEQETDISENIQKAKKETIDSNASELVKKKKLLIVQEKKLVEKERNPVLKNNATEKNIISDKQKPKFQIVKYKDLPMSHKHYTEQKNTQIHIGNGSRSLTKKCESNIKENLEIRKETNTEATENNLLLKQVNKKTPDQMSLSKKHSENNTEYVSDSKIVRIKDKAIINEHLIEQKKNYEACKKHYETIADNTEETIKTEMMSKTNENLKTEKSDLDEEQQKHQNEQKTEKVTHKGILKPQTITGRKTENNNTILRKDKNKRATIICPRLMKENVLSDEHPLIKNEKDDSKIEALSFKQETENSILSFEKTKRGLNRRVTIIDPSIIRKAALSCDLSLVQEEDVSKIKISTNTVKPKTSERQSIVDIEDLKKADIKQNFAKKDELLINKPIETSVSTNELGVYVEKSKKTESKRRYSVLEMAQRYSDERQRDTKR
ncbi:hypothetical protein CDIK_2018 [Cucumispora dikerogammari]|nr:hypothetical protein CDIK_2018 [Cucumispora dikerogammari]